MDFGSSFFAILSIEKKCQSEKKTRQTHFIYKFVAMSRSHLKQIKQDSIEQGRGRFHEEVSSQISVLYVMQLRGVGSCLG